MCGIAGVFGRQEHLKVEKMLAKLTHRGPDGQGLINLPAGTLGHTRLAILDPQGGYQPMRSDHAWITYNGEIYNYRELAQNYLAGIPLQTNCDTEVILKLYRKLGTSFVNLLDGMFSFAIIQGDQLFMARDPLGIKPLYWGKRDGLFYFASEIKSIALVVDEIHEFPAGYWYHSQKGWHRYYLLNPTPVEIDETQVNETIRATLENAVHKRLLADVPVGISLSGGLDSSIIALLASMKATNLYSFAVGTKDSEDIQAARQMANLLGTHHFERIYTEAEILNVLPTVIYHLKSFDAALIRSAIPNFFLSELASQYVKVILTGEGADEIYAGYDYMRFYDSPQQLQDEMIGVTTSLHNTNLQRTDRIPMAFGLEARVPFLDVKSVALGLGLPAQWKLHSNRPAKFLLRQAFSADLPTEITNRPKQKFSQGAGSSNIITRIAQLDVSDSDFQAQQRDLFKKTRYRLPDKEALYYYRILRQYYQDQWIFPTMGHSRSL